MEYKTRKDIPEKYKVNLKELFANNEEFYKELELLKKDILKIENYKGKVFDNLYDLLKLDTDISKRIEKLYIYAHINNDLDLSDKISNDMYGNIYSLYVKYNEMSSYITPELLKKNYSDIETLYKKDKRLLEYEINLKDIFRAKKHTLSDKEELILSKLGNIYNISHNAFSKLTDVDLKFGKILDEKNKKIELTKSNYATYLESSNRNVRKNAFKKMYEGYESIINTNSELIKGEVKKHNTMADIRHYDSSLEASLYCNNVEKKVYETLISEVNNNLKLTQKMWDLRKEVLGLKKFHLYDTYVPLVDNFDKKYTFDEAKDLVLNALKILGDDYYKVLKSSFDNNWIDVYPTKNKRGGGYCTACFLTHPYVFLNYDGRFGEVSTIAHELGHAMHYYYAIKNNSYQNYEYSIFVAEVASQVNELLLSYYMLDNAKSNDEQLFIIDELIKRFKASVVRQTMFSEYEELIHKLDQDGNVLTKDLLCDEYLKLNKRYFGNNVVVDSLIQYEWSRIPHFYYNFYVYQYATGYLAALKISKDIYNKDQKALEKYLKFLGLGCTLDPVSSLKVAGVDLTDKNVYEEGFKEFDSEIEIYKKLLKRR